MIVSAGLNHINFCEIRPSVSDLKGEGPLNLDLQTLVQQWALINLWIWGDGAELQTGGEEAFTPLGGDRCRCVQPMIERLLFPFLSVFLSLLRRSVRLILNYWSLAQEA
ncbi:hypothetical protein Q8A67_024100 [Cirrhinus molitorella]|uniref:Uncharacterized protein n=1 Tax=Cirrhinus molitorella TaxID=172907 RepID=A0AA88PBY4_9TELE|nr:hypothetical protein Q8A67_024100 [Cirrhinus molitorella]